MIGEVVQLMAMAGPGEGAAGGTPLPVVYRTRPVRALGHRFEVVTSDRPLGAYLDTLFAAMAAPGAGADQPGSEPRLLRYAIVEHRPVTGWAPVWELTLDGRTIVRTSDTPQLLAMLLWDVNCTVVQRTSDLLLLHAAAAQHGDAAVILPGTMESGKTTLVAGLLRAGLRYLTDEVTAIDPATSRIVPYPKPLSVDPGSWPVLADLEPSVPDEVRRFIPDQWQVVPESVRAGAVAPGARPRLVVLPRYEPGAATRLERLSRADALIAVSGCVFRFEDGPERALHTLGATLAACDTYQLTSSDLKEGVRAVLDLLGEAAGDGTATTAQGGVGASEASRQVVQLTEPGEQSMARAISPDDVTLDFAPRRHGGVTGVELDGEMVLYAGGGTMHKLDPIATALWNCFDGTVTLGELVEDLASVFDGAGPDRITSDVLTCVRELGHQGLLDNVVAVEARPEEAAVQDGGP